MNLKFGLVFAFCCISTAFAVVLRNLSLDTIHFLTLKMLNNSLRMGWNNFCSTDVDQEVMRLFPESSPSSIEIHLRTSYNETVTISTRELSKLSDFGLEFRSRTLVFVCGINDPQILNVRSHLLNLQEGLTSFNVIIIDFGTSLLQLYSTVKQNMHVSGLLVAQVLGELKNTGVSMNSVTLIGHSVGANIAALGARMFTSDSNRRRLPLLIALDPALMCSNKEFFVDPSVCKKVVVVHAENSVFSEREDIGSIDIYLNGDDGMNQPGCSSGLCSHLYPLVIFIQTVLEERDVIAVKCRDWSAFRKGKCNFNDTVSLGLYYDKRAKGKYYSVAERFASDERESAEDGQIELVSGSVDLLPLPVELITHFNKDPVILK